MACARSSAQRSATSATTTIVELSRRGSVQSVHGFCVSILLQAWRQRQTTSKRLHFFLERGFELTPRIGMSGNNEIFKNLLLVRLEKRIINTCAAQIALSRKLNGDEAAARRTLDFELLELS